MTLNARQRAALDAMLAASDATVAAYESVSALSTEERRQLLGTVVEHAAGHGRGAAADDAIAEMLEGWAERKLDA